MATNYINQQQKGVITSFITYADTGTFSIGNLPKNSVVTDIKVFVNTVWNSSTSNTLTIGHAAFGSTAADVDEFETAIDIKSATGNISLTLLQLGQVLSTTDNVGLTASITSVGTGLSTGAATIMLEYVIL